jgi:type I restriction enzyme S subunit
MTFVNEKVQGVFPFDAGDQTKLPQGWQLLPLGDVADIRAGSSFPPKYQGRRQGDYPFIKVSDMNNEGNALFMHCVNNWVTGDVLKILKAHPFPRYTVIFPKVGGAVYTNKKRLLVTDSIVDNNVMGVAVREQSLCLAEYLLFWFQSIDLSELSNPGPLPSITAQRLKTTQISLPPLTEQRGIAHVLSTIQRAIEAADKVIAAAHAMKQSMLRHLFTFGAVTVQDSSAVLLKETDIGSVPEHWQITKLGQVATQAQYGLSQRGSQTGQVPILRMNNLEGGQVNTDNLQYVDLDAKTLSKFRLNHGDILFNRTNSYELVGKTAMFDLSGDYVFASYLIRLVTDASRLDPPFATYYMNTSFGQAQLKTFASRGVSQSNISASKVKDFRLPLPPLSEQREIVRILSAIDRKLDAETRRKSALQALFKSSLQQLMTGTIRVGTEFAQAD